MEEFKLIWKHPCICFNQWIEYLLLPVLHYSNILGMLDQKCASSPAVTQISHQYFKDCIFPEITHE